MAKFISYLQRVTTVGVVIEAEDEERASELALAQVHNNDSIEKCYFNETHFHVTKTEPIKDD